MRKHSIEKRIAAAKAVEKGETIARVAVQFKMSDAVIRRTIKMIEAHGEEGLKENQKPRTAEEKYQILKYMHENNLTCLETGIQFGINGSATVWDWEHRYREKGMEGLESKKKGKKPRINKSAQPKTREEELLARIEYLEAENEYLKKCLALVAEMEKKERGEK